MKKSFAQMSKFAYPFYIIFHPFDGFQELKYNKKGSLAYGIFFVALWYVAEIFSRSATDFAFNTYIPEKLDIGEILIMTVGMFLVAAISNWCFSTFMDGKGTLPEIVIAGAYCLIPVISSTILCTVLSQFLVLDEQALLSGIKFICYAWSAFLILAAVQEVHDLSFPKTLLMILLTFVGIIVMLFLAFLVYSLAQQVIMFVINISYELIYRITMS